MDLYAENILDHYKHPRHTGTLPAPAVTREEINLSCGDRITLQLDIRNEIIHALAWTGEGCAISQAGMSILSEELIGKSTAEADALTPDRVKELLGVPVGTRRLKCALLSLHALKNALRAHRGEPAQSWHETVGNAEETR